MTLDGAPVRLLHVPRRPAAAAEEAVARTLHVTRRLVTVEPLGKPVRVRVRTVGVGIVARTRRVSEGGCRFVAVSLARVHSLRRILDGGQAARPPPVSLDGARLELMDRLDGAALLLPELSGALVALLSY